MLRGKARTLVLKSIGIDPIVLEFDDVMQLPIVDYGVRSRTQIGRRVNPLQVSMYACKELGLEGITSRIYLPRLRQTETPQYIQRAVEWLISTQKNRGNFSVWENDFPWPPARLQPPWVSALTEAYGALVLLETGHVEDARKHIQSILTDFREGGVGYYSAGSLWFLEYSSNHPPLLVLNGMLQCLLILHEFAMRMRDSALDNGFRLGYKTLKRDLGMFDASFYTLYDSRNTPADQKYHTIHIGLLRTLHSKTGDPYLLYWATRWAKYQRLYPFVEPAIFIRHLIRSGVDI
jgi:hypothetical protein